MLQHGERFSGKTFGALHAAVRHAYLNMNATVMIMTIVKSTGLIGGIWKKLNTLDRDSHDRPMGILQIWHEAIGLEFSEQKSDQARNFFIEVTNQYGQLNRIYFKSLPPGELVSARTRGIEFSFCVIDEISESPNPEHVTKTVQQLDRLQGVGRWLDENETEWEPATQQLYLCTNPPDQGPDSWLFEDFAIKIPTSGGREPIGVKDGNEGVWLHNDDSEFAHYHIPIQENIWVENMDKILSNIRMECVSDPSAEDRLIHGRWIKKITGRGIFQGFWFPHIHVPNLGSNTRLNPIPGYPIILGWDPGDANIARVFMQRFWVKKKERYYYRIFDNIFDLKSQLSYEEIVRAVFDKLAYWNKVVDTKFNTHHVSDSQAMIKWINEGGSFEHAKYEQWSRKLIEEEKYKDLHPIIFEAPSKVAGSVAARVRLLINMLQTETIMVCQSQSNIISMFAQLKKATTGGVEDDFKPKKDSNGWIHMFDALSYPPYLFDMDTLSDQPKEGSSETKLAFSSSRL